MRLPVGNTIVLDEQHIPNKDKQNFKMALAKKRSSRMDSPAEILHHLNVLQIILELLPFSVHMISYDLILRSLKQSVWAYKASRSSNAAVIFTEASSVATLAKLLRKTSLKLRNSLGIQENFRGTPEEILQNFYVFCTN